jgi:hypothetical protein
MNFHPNFLIMPHGGFWYHQAAPSQVIDGMDFSTF